MDVILECDQIGWLIGGAQSVEGDIGGDACPALGAGEQLHQDDSLRFESRRAADGSTTSGTVGGRSSSAISALSLADWASAAASGLPARRAASTSRDTAQARTVVGASIATLAAAAAAVVSSSDLIPIRRGTQRSPFAFPGACRRPRWRLLLGRIGRLGDFRGLCLLQACLDVQAWPVVRNCQAPSMRPSAPPSWRRPLKVMSPSSKASNTTSASGDLAR